MPTRQASRCGISHPHINPLCPPLSPRRPKFPQTAAFLLQSQAIDKIGVFSAEQNSPPESSLVDGICQRSPRPGSVRRNPDHPPSLLILPSPPTGPDARGCGSRRCTRTKPSHTCLNQGNQFVVVGHCRHCLELLLERHVRRGGCRHTEGIIIFRRLDAAAENM